MQYDGFISITTTFSANDGNLVLFVDGNAIIGNGRKGGVGSYSYSGIGTFVKKGQSIYLAIDGTIQSTFSSQIQYYKSHKLIKAVSPTDQYTPPSTEMQQIEQYVDNGLQRNMSYSTTEQWTGGYWIDGKKIYRRCIPFGNKTVINRTQTVTTELNSTYISSLINQGLTWSTGATFFANGSYATFYVNPTNIQIESKGTTFTTGANAYCWLEYTKLTD